MIEKIQSFLYIDKSIMINVYLCLLTINRSYESNHYENTPMQYTEIFSAEKWKISLEIFSYFYFFRSKQTLRIQYTLEPPRRGGSNEYPLCMFWIKNKKVRYTPPNPSFFFFNLKVVFKGDTFHGHVFLMFKLL